MSFRCPAMQVDEDGRRPGAAVAPGSSRSNAAARRVSGLLVAVAEAVAAAPDVAVRYKVPAVEKRPATDGTPGWPANFSRMSPDRDCSATHTYLDQLDVQVANVSSLQIPRYREKARVFLIRRESKRVARSRDRTCIGESYTGCSFFPRPRSPSIIFHLDIESEFLFILFVNSRDVNNFLISYYSLHACLLKLNMPRYIIIELDNGFFQPRRDLQPESTSADISSGLIYLDNGYTTQVPRSCKRIQRCMMRTR